MRFWLIMRNKTIVDKIKNTEKVINRIINLETIFSIFMLICIFSAIWFHSIFWESIVSGIVFLVLLILFHEVINEKKRELRKLKSL